MWQDEREFRLIDPTAVVSSLVPCCKTPMYALLLQPNRPVVKMLLNCWNWFLKISTPDYRRVCCGARWVILELVWTLLVPVWFLRLWIDFKTLQVLWCDIGRWHARRAQRECIGCLNFMALIGQFGFWKHRGGQMLDVEIRTNTEVKDKDTDHDCQAPTVQV